MADMAARTADVLLAAMSDEEPFQLLGALPERLRKLCVVEGQRVENEVGLAEEVALTQSQNYDSICSATSQIRNLTKQVRSVSDDHIRCFQREADVLQDSLEKLRNNHHSKIVPRRNKVKGAFFKDVRNEISNLQSASVRIQDVAQYVCRVAEELAGDEMSLNTLTEQILHEVGLRLDDADAGVRESHHHLTYFDKEGGNSLRMLVKEMEKRCEDLEASIVLNNDIVKKQTEEIVRDILTDLVRANHWRQGRLRRMLDNPWIPPGPVGEMGYGVEQGRGWDSGPCFVPVTIAAVSLATLVALLVTRLIL